MADEINYNGITVRTRPQLKESLENALRDIYGQDISLTQDSPDGQALNIYVQKGADDRELAVQVYNSFDPNSAIGQSLDRIVAINGIRRKPGSYTLVDITIDTDAPVILYGLDQTDQDVFTVQDDAGNRFFLSTTQRIRSNQSVTTRFRAEEIGEVITTVRTITTISTPVVGVTGVNNLLDSTTVTGENEESDFSLRNRRMLAVVRPATGFVDALKADLRSLEGIETAVVEENRTDSTDANGTPAHHLWIIIEGTASDESIANVIYRKRGAGAGMRGTNTHTIQTIDGTDFIAKWDNPLTQNAFLQAEAVSRDSMVEIDYDTLKNDLFASVSSEIGAELNYNQIFCDFIGDQTQPLILNDGGVSTGHEQTISIRRGDDSGTVSYTPSSGEYTLAYNGVESARITTTDTVSQILTKVNAITGVSGVTSTSTSNSTYTLNFPSNAVVADLLSTRNYDLFGPQRTIQVVSMDGTQTTDIMVNDIFFIRNNFSLSGTISTIGRSHKFSLTKDRMVITPLKIFGVPQIIPSGAGEITFTLTSDGGFGDIRYFMGVEENRPILIPSTVTVIGNLNINTGVYVLPATSRVDLETIYFFAVDELGNSVSQSTTIVGT